MSPRLIGAGVSLFAVAIAGGIFFLRTPPSAATAALEIEFGNNSWGPLAMLEVSPGGQNIFQKIPFSEGQLGAGDFQHLTLEGGRAVCVYDLRVTKQDGTVHNRPGADLCAGTNYHFKDE